MEAIELPIETERLLIRPLSLADADDLRDLGCMVARRARLRVLAKLGFVPVGETLFEGREYAFLVLEPR